MKYKDMSWDELAEEFRGYVVYQVQKRFDVNSICGLVFEDIVQETLLRLLKIRDDVVRKFSGKTDLEHKKLICAGIQFYVRGLIKDKKKNKSEKRWWTTSSMDKDEQFLHEIMMMF